MQQARSFLGTGWHFPPAFTAGGGDVEMVSDVEDIHQSIQILFTTQLGERVMLDKFGCDLNTYMFEEIDQSLINSLSRMISDAILYHEPRDQIGPAPDCRESIRVWPVDDQYGIYYPKHEFAL